MLAAFESIPRADRVIVALDCPRAKALDLAVALQGKAKWLKIGMTLYYSEGPAIVEIFKLLGYKVFLDLKCHDIPNQVAGAAASAVEAGADMITMHAVGGVPMMEAAQAAVDNTGCDTATLAITVLTSMDAATLAATGVTRELTDQVKTPPRAQPRPAFRALSLLRRKPLCFASCSAPMPLSSLRACALRAPIWATRAVLRPRRPHSMRALPIS